LFNLFLTIRYRRKLPKYYVIEIADSYGNKTVVEGLRVIFTTYDAAERYAPLWHMHSHLAPNPDENFFLIYYIVMSSLHMHLNHHRFLTTNILFRLKHRTRLTTHFHVIIRMSMCELYQ
jgi:hypothetical protein